MMYILDRQKEIIGVVVPGQVYMCFNKERRFIGRILNLGQHKYLYNKNEQLIALFDGCDTYDHNFNRIRNNNQLFKILYPTMKEIT